MQNQERGEDEKLLPVRGPDRGAPVPKYGAVRKSGGNEAPLLQGRPIDNIGLMLHRPRRDAVGFLAREDTQAKPGAGSSDFLEGIHVAAYDAAIEICAVDAVDRRRQGKPACDFRDRKSTRLNSSH